MIRKSSVHIGDLTGLEAGESEFENDYEELFLLLIAEFICKNTGGIVWAGG